MVLTRRNEHAPWIDQPTGAEHTTREITDLIRPGRLDRTPVGRTLEFLRFQNVPVGEEDRGAIVRDLSELTDEQRSRIEQGIRRRVYTSIREAIDAVRPPARP
jgi:hypothetical protein